MRVSTSPSPSPQPAQTKPNTPFPPRTRLFQVPAALPPGHHTHVPLLVHLAAPPHVALQHLQHHLCNAMQASTAMVTIQLDTEE